MFLKVPGGLITKIMTTMMMMMMTVDDNCGIINIGRDAYSNLMAVTLEAR